MRIERTSLDTVKEMRQVADDFETATDLLEMWLDLERGMMPHRVEVSGTLSASASLKQARDVVAHWTEIFVERMRDPR